MEDNETKNEIPGSVKKILGEDEWVIATVQQSRLKEVLTPDVVILTTQRIILYSPSALGLRKTIEDFRYEDIGNFKINKGILFSSLELKPKMMSEGLKVDNLPKGQMDRISTLVQENIKRANSSAAGTGVTSAGEPPDPLAVLKMRFARGEISKQEYEDMKEILK